MVRKFTVDMGLELLYLKESHVDSWSETENRSTGILRNSINRQNTYGLISKLNYDVNDDLEVQVGIDWRNAGVEIGLFVRFVIYLVETTM